MLEADRLGFTYPGTTRHYELNFTASPGEITAVSGQSGAGKSTLLDLVAGFLTP
ncbi:MAG: ATP-binding cassette domain-containing protein, partial [Acetobacteraceae bacterium]